MPQPVITNVPERGPPTLWPAPLNDTAPMEIAIEASKEERRILKNLAADLLEVILRNLVGKN
jgi:hypothetical protein